MTDLPEDTPVVNLHHMADIDAKKLPKMEESVDRCIHNIQEWMLHECSGAECAVLPEDKLQRILVGVDSFNIISSSQVQATLFHDDLSVQNCSNYSSYIFRLATNSKLPATSKEQPCNLERMQFE